MTRELKPMKNKKKLSYKYLKVNNLYKYKV